MGFVKIQALANSDTRLSPALERASSFSGTVASVAADVISISGAPGWTADQFAQILPAQPQAYYVRFATGAKEGSYFTIVANGASTLTVDLNGESLASVVAGDRVVVVPFWTLGTFLPASSAGVAFEASSSTLLRKTEILVPDNNYTGVNPPASATYYFFNGAWRKVGSAATSSFDHVAVLPDSFVLIRNKVFTSDLTTLGSVVVSDLAISLNAQGAVKQDNVVALQRPIPVTLNASGLISSGAFAASTSTLLRKDELLVFNDGVAGLNKPASATYYYFNSGWRKVGSAATTDFGTDVVFQPGTGVVIRKASTGAGAATVTWINTPTY